MVNENGLPFRAGRFFMQRINAKNAARQPRFLQQEKRRRK